MTREFSNFVFKTVEIRFVRKHHAFQSLLFELTTFLSTGVNFLKIELLVLPEQWLSPCLCLKQSALVSCYSQQQGGSILQLNCPKWTPKSIFGWHLLLCLALLALSSAFICLKAFWRSNCYIWIVSSLSIPLNLKVSEVSLIADKQARQISTPVTSNVVHQALQVLPTLLCAATPDVCRRSRAFAIEQQPRSNHRAGSELTAKKGSLLLWMSKLCSSSSHCLAQSFDHAFGVKIRHRTKSACPKSNFVQSSRFRSTIIPKKALERGISSDSHWTSVLQHNYFKWLHTKFGNNLRHNSDLIAPNVCSQIESKRKAMFESNVETCIGQNSLPICYSKKAIC